MNNHDRENLKFLLNANPDTLKKWYDAVDEDDIEYASEIMARYSEELKVKAVLLDDTATGDQAIKYLKGFRLP